MRNRISPILFLLVILLVGCTSNQPAPTATMPIETAPVTNEDNTSTVDSAPQADLTPTSEVQTPPEGETGSDQLPPFDDFINDSYHQVMMRYPESITELGLDDVFGLPGDQLNNISDAYQRETYALIADIQTQLLQYDRDSLTPEQQLSYDIYAWYLDDTLRGQEFMYYDFPATYYFITAVHLQTIDFFTEIQPVRDLQTVENYITRLSQVGTKFDQLLEGLKLREQAGVIPPRFSLQWGLNGIYQVANSPAKFTPFYTTLKEKMSLLSSITPEEQEDLLARAETEIDASIKPAYTALAEYIDDLIDRAPTDVGVWQYPNGDAYYEYVVRHFTTTEMTPDEIHQLGYQELERIHAEMRVLFDQLGYSADASLPDLFQRVGRESGTLSGKEIVAGYEALIEEAKEISKPVFDLEPSLDVIVIGGPNGGYYVQPAVDGSRPGAFYAQATGTETKFSMPTLAYHEAIPGHHTQIAISLELDLPDFRRGSMFNAYSEGWALYAERLMGELGAYADDPYGDLGRLQGEAFRAARLVVDTGIHSKGWTQEQAVDFMVENTGMPQQQLEYEVARYIVWPGQALAYKIGMIKILELRQMAEEQLGDDYDITEFHNVVLGNGAMPLDILEQIVIDYIAQKQN